MDVSSCHEGDVGSSLTTGSFTMVVLSVSRLFAAPRAQAWGALLFCAKRQKGSLERTAKTLAHDSIPAAAAGRPDGDDTSAAPVGAGAWHCRKWSPEAKNGQAGCQKGRLDGCTESDPSEQTNTSGQLA